MVDGLGYSWLTEKKTYESDIDYREFTEGLSRLLVDEGIAGSGMAVYSPVGNELDDDFHYQVRDRRDGSAMSDPVIATVQKVESGYEVSIEEKSKEFYKNHSAIS